MTKARCRLCTMNPLKSETELDTQVCATCTTKLGLAPLPEPRRPPTPCTRCGGYKFVRAIVRHTVPAQTKALISVTAVHSRLVVSGATWDLDRTPTPYGATTVPDCNPGKPCGVLSRYIC